MGIVLLAAEERHHDIALEFDIGNLQEFDSAVVHLAPGELGPESHAQAARDGVLDHKGVVALENQVGLETYTVAVIFTDGVELLGTVKADKVSVAQFMQRDAVALLVFRRIGYSKVDVLGTDKNLFVGIFLRAVIGESLDGNVVEGGFLFLHQVETERRSVFLVLDNRIGHKGRGRQDLEAHGNGLLVGLGPKAGRQGLDVFVEGLHLFVEVITRFGKLDVTAAGLEKLDPQFVF